MPERIGLYPGTFDPFTLGHLDIVSRAATLFDRLVVGVATNPAKSPLLPLEERLRLVEADATAAGTRVEARPLHGLLIDFARRIGAATIVRGLRVGADFDYEFQMAGMNRRLAPEIETIFLMASERHQFIASSLVRQIAQLGGDYSGFVAEATRASLAQHMNAASPQGPADAG